MGVMTSAMSRHPGRLLCLARGHARSWDEMRHVVRQVNRLAAVEAAPPVGCHDLPPIVAVSTAIGLISLPAMSRAEHHAGRHMLRAAGEGTALENHGRDLATKKPAARLALETPTVGWLAGQAFPFPRPISFAGSGRDR